MVERYMVSDWTKFWRRVGGTKKRECEDDGNGNTDSRSEASYIGKQTVQLKSYLPMLLESSIVTRSQLRDVVSLIRTFGCLHLGSQEFARGSNAFLQWWWSKRRAQERP
jgi:hypothetical protein